MHQESVFISDHSHQLHLKHIWQKEGGTPILMLHGSMENGKIFYTKSGKGLACFLAKHGFDVYVADFRGKGLSKPAIHDESAHGQFELITRDIPKFINYVAEQSQQKVHVICHSWGGVMLACSLLRYPELAQTVASKICFGTKRSISIKGARKLFKLDLVWNRLLPFLAKRKGYVDMVRLKIGADNETRSFLLQCIPWLKQGQWHDPVDNFNYQSSAELLDWPATWHLTGINDKLLGHAQDVQSFIQESNHKARFSLLSKAQGNARNYDHIDILTHPNAVDDHFPQILEWINEHSK